MRLLDTKALDDSELSLFKKLNTPEKIQDFLETIPVNFEEKGETLYSPRKVLKENKAHCFEGALIASACLWFRGERPIILNLQSKKGDEDHVVAIFKKYGCLGAIGKTNHAVLRYREPVYKNIKELAMSYFHEYFLDSGEKTLRMYSDPIDLSNKKFRGWVTSEDDLWSIDDAFLKVGTIR